MPSLIRMKQCPCGVSHAAESLLQHLHYQCHVRAAGDGITDNLPVPHVQHWRQVQLAAAYHKLGYVRGQFLTRACRRKVPVQHIRRNPAHLALIGAVMALRRYAGQRHPAHQTGDRLPVNHHALSTQRLTHPAVAVTPFVPPVDAVYPLA